MEKEIAEKLIRLLSEARLAQDDKERKFRFEIALSYMEGMAEMSIKKMNQQDYNQAMGLNSRDIGSVKLLRAFVNELLEEKGYNKLKGYKSMKELIAIKLKLMGVIK